MRKFKLFLFTGLAMFCGHSVLAQTGIANSAHDFRGDAWYTGASNPGNEICKACHAPHVSDLVNKPLWNRQVTAVTNFVFYTSNTLDAVVGQPDGISKLCLSCHDGTVALENHSGVTNGGTLMTTTNYPNAFVGTNLSGDHPISFTYDGTLATTDGGLHDPSGLGSSGLGGTIEQDMLFDGKLQCASCHDVHNGAGIAKLLVKSNAGSALCLTCHDK